MICVSFRWFLVDSTCLISISSRTMENRNVKHETSSCCKQAKILVVNNMKYNLLNTYKRQVLRITPALLTPWYKHATNKDFGPLLYAVSWTVTHLNDPHAFISLTFPTLLLPASGNGTRQDHIQVTRDLVANSKFCLSLSRLSYVSKRDGCMRTANGTPPAKRFVEREKRESP